MSAESAARWIDVAPDVQVTGREGPRLSSGLLMAGSLLLVALAMRLQFLGNPLLDSDEGFYLLVGERMLHGALPFVDIWDRKPVGLFLLFAALRRLGGDGVLAYQLAGTLVVAATAFLVARLSRQFAPRGAAMVAGMIYLAWMVLGSAAGGQAELFLALPVSAAGLITMKGLQTPRAPGIWSRGLLSMLLIGLAAQIKYSALFEGLFFGCCWLVIAWRAGSRRWLPLLATSWVCAAVLPTAAAAAWYAAHGHLEEFVFANFVSVFRRGPTSSAVLMLRIAGMSLLAVPLLACIRVPSLPARDPGRVAFRFTLGWLVASMVGMLALRSFLGQYLLPMMVPASAVTAPFFAKGPSRRAVLVLALALFAGQARLWVTQRANGSRLELARITQQVDPGKCLFIYSGLSSLYRITGECMPTKYAFPSHLSRAREAGSIGTDPVAEVGRIMSQQPGTVLVREPYKGDENWAARAALMASLGREYHIVYHGSLGWHEVDVYRRNVTDRPAAP